MSSSPPSTSFARAVVPVLILVALVGYGLVWRPLIRGEPPWPVEIVFILAAGLAASYLALLGHRWVDLLASITAKLAQALPAFFVLFAIGMLIASWIVAGTIPMLVAYGLRLVDPQYFYVVAFVVAAVFSMLTGTSWGSIGSVGVVLIGIAKAFDADMGIAAGAIVGGAFFGDKMSPVSDTTNMAALATGVELLEHIRSMLYTTAPSALLAAVAFSAAGFVWPPGAAAGDTVAMTELVSTLARLFVFHPLLVLPVLTILIGSWRGYPILPLLAGSTVLAGVLAVMWQPFVLSEVLGVLIHGFTVAKQFPSVTVPDSVRILLDRGGLYSLQPAIVTAFTVFVFIGVLDHVQAMPRVVERVFGWAKTSASTVLASLLATGITNALTANQYATSFIIGDAFRHRYDRLRIPRRVLSRSLEDTGTMLESLVPWTPSALFAVSTLGVAYGDYWHWQLLSLINLAVAPLLAATGIGCGYATRPWAAVERRETAEGTAMHDRAATASQRG